MPKKRRKLNSDFEKLIAKSKKETELITAKIHDIDEEEIQDEYKSAFTAVLQEYMNLEEAYKTVGFNEDVENIYKSYLLLMEKFTDEFEI